MFKIRNTEDLRLAYVLLREYQNGRPTGTHARFHEKALKREIRDYVSAPVSDRTCITNEYDRAIILYPLPDYLETEDAADRYFKTYEYIDSPYSAYDCTGASFTAWYKLTRRRGRWYVYHCICLDC